MRGAGPEKAGRNRRLAHIGMTYNAFKFGIVVSEIVLLPTEVRNTITTANLRNE